MTAASAPARGRTHLAVARDALCLDAVHKTVAAGVPGCLVRARVLDGVSLRVAAGEIVVVAGASASGKTLLLLCAAGLATCDRGRVTPRARGCYVRAPDLARAAVRARLDRAHVVLLDDADSGAARSFAAACRARGAVVLAAVRDAALFAAAGARVVELRGGRLAALAMRAPPASHRVARVAEERMALR